MSRNVKLYSFLLTHLKCLDNYIMLRCYSLAAELVFYRHFHIIYTLFEIRLFYATVLPENIHAHHMCAWCLNRYEEIIRSPETGVKMDVSHDEGTGNRTRVLCKSNNCYLPLNRRSSPFKYTLFISHIASDIQTLLLLNNRWTSCRKEKFLLCRKHELPAYKQSYFFFCLVS